MAYEANPTYRQETPDEQARIFWEEQKLHQQRLQEASPAIGDLVLFAAFSGTLTGGALMPKTEVIVLEGLTAATNLGDRYQEDDLARSA
jgi:hypothetical protein